MALNLKSLMKLGKEKSAVIVLYYKDKFDTTLTNINKELTDLPNKSTKQESSLKQVIYNQFHNILRLF